jgi:curved DNA-binding protein CbpA
MPADYFAQLQLPRRPRLQEDIVRNAFHRVAAQVHPDRPHGSTRAFANLTTAFETLKNPVSLVRHLIDLENIVIEPAQSGVPGDLIDLFPLVAETRQQLASALAKCRGASSALARSLAMAAAREARSAAEEADAKIDRYYQQCLSELDRLDASWPSSDARSALPPLHVRLAFVTKWREQLREALLQLELAD